MNIHAAKTRKNKSRSAAVSVSRTRNSGGGTAQLADKRPEAVAQRKQQEMLENSPRVAQLKTLRQLTSRCAALQRPQAKGIMVPGKGETVQRKLKQVGLGVSSGWKAIRSAISTYNDNGADAGVFVNIINLNNVADKAMIWETQSDVLALMQEIGTEKTALLTGSAFPLLSSAHRAVNGTYNIIGSVELFSFGHRASQKPSDVATMAERYGAVSPTKQLYMMKAYAAGRSLGDIDSFLGNIGGWSDGETEQRLNLTPIGTNSPTQQYQDFCSGTTVQIFEARFDPLVAYDLRTKNEDMSLKMADQGVDPTSELWVQKAIAGQAGDLVNNRHMLAGQYEIAKRYSTDSSGRMGLSRDDRARALTGLRGKTNLQYVGVSITGLKKVIVPDEKEGTRTIESPGVPEEKRVQKASYLLIEALKAGAPVGVGIGGHAALFIGLNGSKAILYEPSFGNTKEVAIGGNIDNGFIGSDTIVNLVLPKNLAKQQYKESIQALIEMGEAEDTVLDATKM